MSKYELWGKHKDSPNYEKISEFDGRQEIECRINELLATGDYSEAIVIRDFRYVLGKEYTKSKVKRRD